MTDDFQQALANINRLPLDQLNEEEVKHGVILPLLKRVGWNSEDPTEVKPAGVGQNAVDYALRIDGVDQAFVEAKASDVDLTKHQSQLFDYCKAAKVNLGVLTNGRTWWFYLHKRGQRWEQRRFLENDIRAEDVSRIENEFRECLSRDRFFASGKKKSPAVLDAEKILHEREDRAAQSANIVGAWNIVPEAYPQELVDFISSIVEKSGKTRPRDELVLEFLEKHQPLKKVELSGPNSPRSKPVAVKLYEDKREVSKWNEVHVTLCQIIYAAHPDNFQQQILEIRGPRNQRYFSTNDRDFRNPKPIGSTGVYVIGHGSAKAIKEICNLVVDRFRIPATEWRIETC